MHKKGITEEVAKKRSRKTVKHQRGIVGADLATIAARRNQTAAVRTQQRLAAITKAKSEKKEKETKKAKVRVLFSFGFSDSYCIPAPTRIRALRPQGIEAANEGWQGWKMIVTTLILAFEHCNRASDIVVQLHPSVVFIGTFIQSHFRPRIRHDIFVSNNFVVLANSTNMQVAGRRVPLQTATSRNKTKSYVQTSMGKELIKINTSKVCRLYLFKYTSNYFQKYEKN